MNNLNASRRPYVSALREEGAIATRARILDAARMLFERHGVDDVTIATLARAAAVSPSTIYSLFSSKAGILHALMEDALFGERYQTVIASLDEEIGSVDRLVATARIARAIYEGESAALGLLRGVCAFSQSLRELEQTFEERRYEMQRDRVERVWREGLGSKRISLDEARRLLWTYTSREIYRMLVEQAGWTPLRYQEWLEDTLLTTLVDPDVHRERIDRK